VNHPAAQKKRIKFQEDTPKVKIYTDTSLLSRVLSNMIINALEATAEGGDVKVWAEQTDRFLTLCVWNEQRIPENIAHRIFQRNFSTKGQAGRGVGTFSMKLFGEKILGGQVDFESSMEKGTVFKFSLPL
jgi:signal transduction histidine kinase